MRRLPAVSLLILLGSLGAWLIYDRRHDAPDATVASEQASPAPSPQAPAAGEAAPEAGTVSDEAPAATQSARSSDPAAPPREPGQSGLTVEDRASGSGSSAPVAPASPPAEGDWSRLAEIAPGADSAGAVAPPAGEDAPTAELPATSDVEPDPAGADERRQATLEVAPAERPGGTSEPRAASSAAVATPLVARPDVTSPGAAQVGGAEPLRPSFDIVRVGRDGRAVVAGRAAPGAEVELRAGDRVLDRVRASRSGDWVATPAEPLEPGGQELTLAARNGEGAPVTLSEQVVVVALPEPPPPQPAAVAISGPPPPQPAAVAVPGPPPPQPAAVAVSGPPPPQPAEVAMKAPPVEAVAVLLPRDGKAAGRILQAPGRISSDGRLALLVLDYDHAGKVRIGGEGPPGAPVRVYVDNQPAGEVLVGAAGQWSTVLQQQLSPGDYTLRLDQIGSGGRPVARLETPFTRVRQPPVAGTAQVDYVIVQPGNSLWRIARRLFGDGFKYVHLYDANNAQIRDPDMIYPGQVFEVPAALRSAG